MRGRTKWILSFLFCLFLLSLSTITWSKQEKIEVNPEALQKFSRAIATVKRFYVNSVDDQVLFNSAIRGALEGLDPHSVYLDKEMFKELKAQTTGEFIGLGVEITQEKGIIKVISPIDDTPAAKAGIQAGDYILSIDHKPLLNIPLMDVIKKMRGKPGSSITLGVWNQQNKKLEEMTIKRARIHIQSVKYKMLEPGWGYIRISHFQEDTEKKLTEAITMLQRESPHQKLKGLILDLRNNPGGLMDVSIEVADVFIDTPKKQKRKIVYTMGRIPEMNQTTYARPGDFLNGAPLMVLINQGSASASEIVAGALQDDKRAIIVGQPSFGKGSLQTVLPLDDETGIKLTTALYYTPLGRSIQATGIEPDILIEPLNIEKTKTDLPFEWPMQEKNMPKHLKNGNGLPENFAPKNTDETKLATEDYQLYEALQLLKGLQVMKKLSL